MRIHELIGKYLMDRHSMTCCKTKQCRQTVEKAWKYLLKKLLKKL